MELFLFLTVSAAIIGSTLSKIIAKIFVYQKGVNLFKLGLSQNIPSFSLSLAQSKSFDLIEYVSFLIISVCLFLVFLFLYKNRKYNSFQKTILGLSHLIFAIFLYINVNYATYSGTQTFLLTIVWLILQLGFSFLIPKTLPKWQTNKVALFNGVSVGMLLTVLANNLSTSIALSLAIFFVTPFYFYALSSRLKLLKNPLFIVSVLGVLFPFNRIALLIVGIATIALPAITRDRNPKFFEFIYKIYPGVLVFLAIYNPIFYLGTFDSIEEGFWAGWLERMLRGQSIYKDFAAYHPPFLAWGLFGFTKIFGASLYNLRLYFHLLQITGLVIAYYFLQKFIESKLIRFSIFVLIASYGLSLVHNNMEIRVFSGILPFIFIYLYTKNKSKINLLLAGIFTIVSFFVSLETGISAIGAVSLTVLLISWKKDVIKNVLYYTIGCLCVTIPVFLTLYLTSSLSKFFEYIVYYASTFANGYQNFPVDRFESQTLVQWFLINKYLTSAGFLWEMSKVAIFTTASITIYKYFKKEVTSKDNLALGLSVFGFILGRSALGRSDQYHVIFVWVVALILTGHILEIISKYSKIVPVTIIAILFLFIGREYTQLSLIQNQLIKLQTYGNVSGSYPGYKTKRAGILTGIDIKTADMDNLVNYIDSNSTQSDTIFVYPQEPEIYFLTDRLDATRFDTPTAFYTNYYQDQMIEQLKSNHPKFIVYDKSYQTPEFTIETLSKVNKYLKENYKMVQTFGKESVYTPINK